jgi:hypothetical protein
MHRVHFVVAIRPDEEKAADPVVGENDAKQSERGGVGPLQIVEKEDDDPLARAEGAQELPDGAVEAVRGFRRAELRNGGLRTDDQLEIRQHVEDHPRVRLQRLDEIPPPDGEPRLAFRQELADQVTNRRHETRVRDVALQLVELPADEVAPRLRDRLVDLVDQCRLADAGVASDQEHLRRASARALEGLEQPLDFVVAPIEPFRDLEPFAVIVPARLEPLEPGGAAHCFEIGHQACRALVAALGLLGHQLGDDLGEGQRDVRITPMRRDRFARDLGVNQLDLVVCVERTAPRDHLVERRAE